MRLVCRALILAFAWLPAVVASAQAAESITVTFGPDPTEEVPLPIRMSWTTADADPFVVVTIKRFGLRGCGATHAIDDPNSTDVLVRRGGFTGTAMRVLRPFAGPGRRILCGYLQRSPGDPAPLAVTGPITVPVRSGRATVAVTAPARVAPRQAFALKVSVIAELRRYVFVTSKPAGARGCAPSHAFDDPVSLDVLVSYVHGMQTRTRTIFASRIAGTYLLCAYIQEGGRDPAPEAVGSTTYLVGPDPCLSAKAALAKAERAVKKADRSVRRYRRSYKRYQRRARHVRGAERTRLQRLARRDKRRYRSAIRRRAKARAMLATAQANIPAACPSG